MTDKSKLQQKKQFQGNRTFMTTTLTGVYLFQILMYLRMVCENFNNDIEMGVLQEEEAIEEQDDDDYRDDPL